MKEILISCLSLGELGYIHVCFLIYMCFLRQLLSERIQITVIAWKIQKGVKAKGRW